MNRFLKVLCLLSFVAVFTGCKDDDSASIPPPRDYGVQYTTEKADIENYLKTHYIAGVDADMNINLQPIPGGGSQVSIWDQTDYPLQNKMVNRNNVDYTVYYLVLNEGVGDSPTQYDNILAAYRGTLLDGTQFDYMPFPQSLSSLGGAIEGWKEIIPLFKSGVYVDEGGPDPASFQDFGAGVMFLPSGLAYYNTSPAGSSISPYSSMIFNFKLYTTQYVDNDNDGILTRDETEPGIAIANYDTDGDGTPNYLDADDDNDGVPTKTEITNNGVLYPFDEIPACPSGNGKKKHLDPACY